jgi:hypothetical protein
MTLAPFYGVNRANFKKAGFYLLTTCFFVHQVRPGASGRLFLKKPFKINFYAYTSDPVTMAVADFQFSIKPDATAISPGIGKQETSECPFTL